MTVTVRYIPRLHVIDILANHQMIRLPAELLEDLMMALVQPRVDQADGDGVTIDATWKRRGEWRAAWGIYRRNHQRIVDDAASRFDRALERLDQRATVRRPVMGPRDAMSAILQAQHDARVSGQHPTHIVVSSDVLRSLHRLTLPAHAQPPTPGGRMTIAGMRVRVSEHLPPRTAVAYDAGRHPLAPLPGISATYRPDKA